MYRTRLLGSLVRSPPLLKMIEREGAVDTATLPQPVEVRESFSQPLLGDFHAEGLQKVSQLPDGVLRNVRIVVRTGLTLAMLRCIGRYRKTISVSATTVKRGSRMCLLMLLHAIRAC